MACGTPVISSKRGALKEVLGDYAIFIDPLNPNSIASGMKEVLKNENILKSTYNYGPQNAKKFNWKKTASQIDFLIKNKA